MRRPVALDPPAGKFKDPQAAVAVAWSGHLQNTAVQNRLRKRSADVRALPAGRAADA